MMSTWFTLKCEVDREHVAFRIPQPKKKKRKEGHTCIDLFFLFFDKTDTCIYCMLADPQELAFLNTTVIMCNLLNKR